MQMELLKKPVRSYRTIDISEPEEMFEHNIIVPDSKPDVKNILLADAEGFVLNVEKTGRMIEVSGEIRYRVLYVADTPEQRIENIVSSYPWSFSVPKPKNEGDVGVFARCRCQHSETGLANSRKIVCRTVTSLVCRFYEIKSDEIGREILGENVYLKTVPVNVITLKDNGDITSRVTDLLSLPQGSPAIKEVLFSHVNLGRGELSWQDEEPCLEAKGTLYLLYRSDNMDESIESVVLEFPVRTQTGVQASADAMMFTTSVLRDWEIKAAEDADGLNTQISISLEVEIDAQAMAQEEQVVIDDAYSVDCQMDLTKAQLGMITDEREICDTHNIDHHVRLEASEAPDVRLDEVLMVCAGERNIASKVSERNVNAQGTISVDILYRTSNREIRCQSLELPFTKTFALPDDGMWQVVQTCFSIEEVNFDISGSDSLELSISLKIMLRTAKSEEVTCTDALNVVNDDNKRKAPIILYFAQPEDTMWSIAKKYRIPVSKLAVDNSIDASVKPEAGKRLFIM